MYEAGFIRQKEYHGAMAEKLALAPFRLHEKKTGFFIEYAKQTLEEYLPDQDEVFSNGLNLKTTISLPMTQYAYDAIEKGMKLYRERNPKVKVLPEVALIAMEVKTGEIKTMIGGRDFAASSSTGQPRQNDSQVLPSSPSSILPPSTPGSSRRPC